MYGICKIVQTYRDKVVVSRGIANQRGRVTGAWEEEEHCQIIFRGVGLPPPHLNLVVAQHLKSSVNLEASLRVYHNSHILRLCSTFFFNVNLQWLVTKNTRRELVLRTLFWHEPSCAHIFFLFLFFSIPKPSCVQIFFLLLFIFIYIWTFMCPYIFFSFHNLG
jgi:hypothetical protein